MNLTTTCESLDRKQYVATLEHARKVASECASENGFSDISALVCAEAWFVTRAVGHSKESDLYNYVWAALLSDDQKQYEEPELSQGINDSLKRMALNT